MLTCGCCAMGCCCWNHCDIPRGIVPHTCDRHATIAPSLEKYASTPREDGSYPTDAECDAYEHRLFHY